MREWKPGDVARINEDETALCVRSGILGGSRDEGVHWIVATGQELWSSVKVARPLVVIDPEDAGAIDKLLTSYHAQAGGRRDRSIRHMQAALRSLIEPPKPEEPTGLGAVVEDAGGTRWIKIDVHKGCNDWTVVGNYENPADNTRRWKYVDINVVRVLSQGVTP